MKFKSFAKLNLCLDVVRKRKDGYHELDSVMVPIDLFDTISITISEKMQIETNKGFLPLDDRNTVIKAIEILRKKYKFKENFDIKLRKNTPTQGGLGGGSSNAATTIRMINKMLNLEMTEKEMITIASKVGADVAFCVYGRPARVLGFGDIVIPIEDNSDFYMFIAKPKWGVSTPEAFKGIDHKNLKHPNCDKVIKALKNNDYKLLIDNIDNSLEDSAFKLMPKIKKLKEDLIKFGFDNAVMSGSGSTVFAISKDEDLVDRAVVHFVNKQAFVKKTRIVKDVRKEEIIDLNF